MSNVHQITEDYYKAVQKAVFLSSRDSETELIDFKKNLDAFAIENPDLEYGDLVTRFGSPEDIQAMLFPDEVNSGNIPTIRFTPKKVIIIGLILAVLIVLIAFGIILWNSKIRMEQYYEIILTMLIY